MERSSSSDEMQDRLRFASQWALALPFIMAPLFWAMMIWLRPILPTRQGGTISFVGWAFLAWHAAFICLIAYAARSGGFAPAFRKSHVWINASLILTLVFGLFVNLDDAGQRYFCVDGIVHNLSIVPNLPWILIGWTLLVGLGMPERVFNWLDPTAAKLLPLRERLVQILPAGLIVFFVGAFFQFRPRDCTWVGYDGLASMVMRPITALFIGAFIYILCVSIIILSAWGTGTRENSAPQNPNPTNADKG